MFLKVLQQRLVGGVAERAEVPLEVADPEDQFGDGDGAGVEFQAEELVRVDGEAAAFEQFLGFAELAELFAGFALQLLHVLHRDVEEVGRPAGGIEHDGAAQVGEEIVDRLAGLVVLPLHVAA